MNFWSTCQSFFPCCRLREGSRSSFQATTQNLKICRLLCAEDWFDCSSPIKVNCLHSIDLIWLFGHQFLRYVEHLFHCEIFWILDGMLFVWVILHHEYRCLQCWRHEHSPYHRMLFVVFCCIHWGLFLFFSNLIIHLVHHFSIIQVFADHMRRRSGVDNKFSFLRIESCFSQAPIFRRWQDWCFVFLLCF